MREFLRPSPETKCHWSKSTGGRRRSSELVFFEILLQWIRNLVSREPPKFPDLICSPCILREPRQNGADRTRPIWHYIFLTIISTEKSHTHKNNRVKRSFLMVYFNFLQLVQPWPYKAESPSTSYEISSQRFSLVCPGGYNLGDIGQKRW